mgnify:CR=1 FL=1
MNTQNSVDPLPLGLSSILCRSLLIGTLSATGLLGGGVPGLFLNQGQLTLDWGTAAMAQEFTSEEITNYAKAVLALEARRLNAMQEIQKIVGDVPRIVCNDSNSIRTLPGNAPRIAVDYCAQAKRIIEQNNLTVAEFNGMTRRQQANVSFRQRIQAEMLRLREAQ